MERAACWFLQGLFFGDNAEQWVIICVRGQTLPAGVEKECFRDGA